MWTALRAVARPCWRPYSSAAKPSVDIKALAALRKVKSVSISKAREALAATGNDIDAASTWLDKDLAGSGAQKLAKLQDRPTNEGVIAIYVLSSGLERFIGGQVRAAMVELSCETDFVARNQLFRSLATDIAFTAAYLAEPTSDPIKQPFYHYNISDFGEAHLCMPLKELPVPLSEPINDHIRNTVAKVGEKIALRRAVALAREVSVPHVGFRLASYVHGGVDNDPNAGRVGTLVDMALHSSAPPSLKSETAAGKSLEILERALARQVVGLDPARIQRLGAAGSEDPEALYDQEFMMHPTMSGERVETALQNWSSEHGLEDLQVNNFVRWKVGESDSQ